jgi:hypothetical protein
VWHIKEPFLLKVVSAKHSSKFAARPSLPVTDAHQRAEKLLVRLKTIKQNQKIFVIMLVKHHGQGHIYWYP